MAFKLAEVGRGTEGENKVKEITDNSVSGNAGHNLGRNG